MIHSTAPATGKGIPRRNHSRLVWAVGLLWAVNTLPSPAPRGTPGPQPLTFQSPTVQEPQGRVPNSVEKAGGWKSGKGWQWGEGIGVVVLLGCVTPKGQVPPVLGALRLWEEALPWELRY